MWRISVFLKNTGSDANNNQKEFNSLLRIGTSFNP